MMKINKLLLVVAVILLVSVSYGCKKKQAAVADPCAYKYAAEVLFNGPGGHSSGAYGNTNALNAAGNTVTEMMSAKLPVGVVLSANMLVGGNSVNSIAGTSNLLVEGCSPTAEGVKALADVVSASATKGAALENAFRNITDGQINSAGVRLDIRAEVKEVK